MPVDQDTFFFELLLIGAGLVVLAAFVAVMTIVTSKRRDQVVNVNFDAEKAREKSERFVGKAR